MVWSHETWTASPPQESMLRKLEDGWFVPAEELLTAFKLPHEPYQVAWFLRRHRDVFFAIGAPWNAQVKLVECSHLAPPRATTLELLRTRLAEERVRVRLAEDGG